MNAALESATGAPRALRGFDGIRRYWDGHEGRWIAQVLPGDFYVTKHDEIIATVLGSCVSTCVRDEVAGVGGLNHFMLPSQGSDVKGDDALRYGCYAVERLINELVKYGARRERMEVKIFGGGKVIAGMGDIGRKNIDFVHEYFATEGLPIEAEDTGGVWARRVRYFAATGKVMIQRLQTQEANEVVRSEGELRRKISVAPPRGEVDLFD
ncbi:MAG TPA: chemoreceptor glutamine deamidase CheD [Polyangiaceae bacterium]|nr:chemoreceptor glutamine deamidase CheD [Polyangiaceae bacterium]